MHKYRLHELEGALELFSSDPFVFRPSELYKVEGSLRKELERYNLYIVARRPRLSLIPSSLVLDAGKNTVSGVIEAQLGEQKEHFPFKAVFTTPFQIERLDDHQFPFDFLRLWATNGYPIQVRLHDVLRFCEQDYAPVTDMYVEYVGQAFGEEGERDVVDRLIGNTGKAGHGSLQQVLAEVNASHPDQEVHLLLYSFEFHKRIVIGGGFFGTPEPKYSIDDAPERFEQFFESKVKRHVRIDLAEAALIRYFAPQYNVKYKKTFPAQTHKILDRLHELDVTGLAVSLSTQEHRVRLFSTAVAPSDTHIAIYPITQDENRISFFDIAIPSSGES